MAATGFRQSRLRHRARGRVIETEQRLLGKAGPFFRRKAQGRLFQILVLHRLDSRFNGRVPDRIIRQSGR